MNRLVIDVEAAGPIKKPVVYDVGLTIADSQFHIIDQARYIVRETWENTDLIASAYYADKLPNYQQAIDNNELETLPFLTIWRKVRAICKRYNVRECWAFNAAYDRRALNHTISLYSNGFQSYFLPYGVKWYCLQSASASTLCKLQRYYKFVADHGLLTKKGFVPTSAEAVYSFIIGDASHVEAHTALQDATEETVILAEVKRRHVRKSDSVIDASAWYRPQPGFKKWLEKNGRLSH